MFLVAGCPTHSGLGQATCSEIHTMAGSLLSSSGAEPEGSGEELPGVPWSRGVPERSQQLAPTAVYWEGMVWQPQRPKGHFCPSSMLTLTHRPLGTCGDRGQCHKCSSLNFSNLDSWEIFLHRSLPNLYEYIVLMSIRYCIFFSCITSGYWGGLSILSIKSALCNNMFQMPLN